jgi:hypothetical protein
MKTALLFAIAISAASAVPMNSQTHHTSSAFPMTASSGNAAMLQLTAPYVNQEIVPEQMNDQELCRYIDKQRKQTLECTKRGVQVTRETNDIANAILNEMEDQAFKLDKIAGNVALTEAHARVAEAEAENLKSCCCFPCFGKRKVKKTHGNLRDIEKMIHAGAYNQAERLTERPTNLAYTAKVRGELVGPEPIYKDHGYAATPSGVPMDETEDAINTNLKEIEQGVGNLKQAAQRILGYAETDNSRLDNVNDGAFNAVNRMKDADTAARKARK